jgi:hypothetical protein
VDMDAPALPPWSLSGTPSWTAPAPPSMETTAGPTALPAAPRCLRQPLLRGERGHRRKPGRRAGVLFGPGTFRRRPPALSRLERDVLSLSGVAAVVWGRASTISANVAGRPRKR